LGGQVGFVDEGFDGQVGQLIKQADIGLLYRPLRGRARSHRDRAELKLTTNPVGASVLAKKLMRFHVMRNHHQLLKRAGGL
jgi:hypothetical protein